MKWIPKVHFLIIQYVDLTAKKTGLPAKEYGKAYKYQRRPLVLFCGDVVRSTQ